MKALIADDDMYVRACLIQMIPWKELDFSQVLEAANGTETLEIALREKPDLIITDVKMPHMTGIELARRIREEMLDVCIIVLSEYSDFSFVQEALQCGVNDYLLKPLTAEKLNAISDKIRQTMMELDMRRFYTSMRINPESIREIIRDMMESGDVQSVLDTFDYLARTRIYRDDLKHFAVMFLSELFEQALPAAFNRPGMEQLRRESMAACAGTKRVDELLVTVKDTCAECLRLCAAGSAAADSHVSNMVEYIDGNYMDPDLSVAKVSDWVHLSPIYTGALFKKSQGKSIVTYIHEVRILQAKRLLQDPDVSIREISERVGYMTPDYFTRLFRKEVGMTPSRYRTMTLDGSQNGR